MTSTSSKTLSPLYPSQNDITLFPAELVARIFWLIPPKSIESPANYTQVCSYWRAVARSSPEIWTTLTLEPPAKLQTRTDADSFEAALIDWISCASNSTIDLPIHDHAVSKWPLDFRESNTLELYVMVYRRVVVEYSNKWRQLISSISWDAWDFLSEVQRPVSLTALEELTLSVRSIQPDWILSSDPPFYNSKYLHTLHLKISYEVKSYPFLEALLTKTVRVLTVDCAAGIFEDFLRPFLDLSQLQRITHMSLTRIHWTDATPDPTFPMATLMNLQELKVDGSVLGLSRSLAVLTLPSLVKLSLSSKTYPSDGLHGPIVGPALLSFMERKSHLGRGLLALTLTGLLSDDSYEVITLSSLSNILSTDAASEIQELHIEAQVGFEDPNMASLMEILRYDSNNSERQLLPHLTTFSATCLCFPSLPTHSPFANFVHSRWWPKDSKHMMPGVAKLERLVLEDCRLSKKTEKWLRMCYESGLSDK
ncbi:hypothetical protein FB446DRAFT_849004 [Lentinula raphanica]|nr:hypothetical protein FB446DRAFT_849004 [Lentinula raphanica]